MRTVVRGALEGLRVDRAVAIIAGLSRTEAERLIGIGAVRVGGQPQPKSRRLVRGDVVDVDLVRTEADPGKEELPSWGVATAFVDDDVAVLDKPAGVVVHPGSGGSVTLVDLLLVRFPHIAGVGDPQRPGIVHRLDKGTSGLMMVALSQRAHDSLSAQIRSREVERRYKCLVHGSFLEDRGVIDAPVGRSGANPTLMAVSRGGRKARTHFQVEERFERPLRCALLECRLETGRTHQVRVHLASVDHPVVGDRAYGSEHVLGLGRPFLHACYLAFDHPVSGKRIELASELPGDLRQALYQLAAQA